MAHIITVIYGDAASAPMDARWRVVRARREAGVMAGKKKGRMRGPWLIGAFA